MSGGVALTLVAFIAGSSLLALVGLIVTGWNRRLEGRLQDLARPAGAAAQPQSVSKITRRVLPRIGSPLVPTSRTEETRLRTRLIHAGFYSRHAMVVFLGVKMLLIVLPAVAGMVAAATGAVPLLNAALYGLLGSCAGMVGPNLWLDSRKKKRQTVLRRSLPDALDMVVVCLKGGLSLQAAFQRVTAELAMAHPLLAQEFSINQREAQLGRSIGEAMRHFADRSDLEEIRGLGSVILQAERLGASTVQAMRVHAETLRQKRLQRAEEKAHTAGTKLVFPTILCIFPSILLVVAGPAAFQVVALFKNMK
jgi:tight adherence protein C